MDVILWRHAQAELIQDGMTDAERKLTAKGLRQASKMGSWLDRVLPDSCKILVSPTNRTMATSEGLLEFGRKRKICEELGPDAQASDILTFINWPEARDPVLIIGHQPYLGDLAAQLLGHAPKTFSVKKGSVWWISQKSQQNDDGQTTTKTFLKAVLGPELVTL